MVGRLILLYFVLMVSCDFNREVKHKFDSSIDSSPLRFVANLGFYSINYSITDIYGLIENKTNDTLCLHFRDDILVTDVFEIYKFDTLNTTTLHRSFAYHPKIVLELLLPHERKWYYLFTIDNKTGKSINKVKLGVEVSDWKAESCNRFNNKNLIHYDHELKLDTLGYKVKYIYRKSRHFIH